MTQHAPQTLAEPEGPARLAQVLSRLATPPADLRAERQHMPARMAERLDLLLREIDETVLPRRLVLQAEGRDIAQLDVAGRRLLSLATDDAALDAAETPLGEMLDALVQVTRQASSLATTTLETKTPADGPTAATLRAHLRPPQGQNDIDRMVTLMASSAQASLRWSEDAQTLNLNGDAKWHKTLVTYTRRLRRVRKPGMVAHATPEGLLLPLSGNDVVLLMYSGTEGLAAVLPRDAGYQAITRWQLSA